MSICDKGNDIFPLLIRDITCKAFIKEIAQNIFPLTFFYFSSLSRYFHFICLIILYFTWMTFYFFYIWTPINISASLTGFTFSKFLCYNALLGNARGKKSNGLTRFDGSLHRSCYRFTSIRLFDSLFWLELRVLFSRWDFLLTGNFLN